MSQRSVQLVIGKLITDTGFRRHFENRGRECLASLCERGVDLSETEIAALVDTSPRLWLGMAMRIDRRLRKVAAPSEREDQRPYMRLGVRERQVLRGIFEGLTNKEIATEAGVSETAVKATLQRLFRKTRVRTRAQLVRVAIDGTIGVARRTR